MLRDAGGVRAASGGGGGAAAAGRGGVHGADGDDGGVPRGEYKQRVQGDLRVRWGEQCGVQRWDE